MKSLIKFLGKAVLAVAGVASLCFVIAEPAEGVTSGQAWLLKLASLVIFAIVLKTVEAAAQKES